MFGGQQEQENQGDREQSRQEAISPLVREAEAFALFLNPPAPPVPMRQNFISCAFDVASAPVSATAAASVAASVFEPNLINTSSSLATDSSHPCSGVPGPIVHRSAMTCNVLK